MTVMNQQRSWCRGGVHYIDAFSGSGRPKARDEDRFIKGSPQIALDQDPPFDSYTFIELSGWRADRLRALQDEYPSRRVRIIEGDCNDVIRRVVTSRFRGQRDKRGFVLLDPFGTQLEWETIADIASTGSLETIINFPTMGCNRAGLPKDPDALTDRNRRIMNRVWGDESWYDLLYEERRGLWDIHVVKRAPTSALKLGQLFRARLLDVFGHVSEPRVICNAHNVPIYCLMFAGHNKTGAKIADYVLKERATLPQMLNFAEPERAPAFAQAALL